MKQVKNSFLFIVAMLAMGFTLVSRQSKHKATPGNTRLDVPYCYVQTIKLLQPGNCTAPPTIIGCITGAGKPVKEITNPMYSEVECDEAGTEFCCAQLSAESSRQCFNQLHSSTGSFVDGMGGSLSGYIKIGAVYCKN